MVLPEGALSSPKSSAIAAPLTCFRAPCHAILTRSPLMPCRPIVIRATMMNTIPGLQQIAQFQFAPRMMPLWPVPTVMVLSLSAQPELPAFTSNLCATRVTTRIRAIRT